MLENNIPQRAEIFATPIYILQNNFFLEDLIKLTDSYIEDAIQLNKSKFVNNNDFGLAHHSVYLQKDPNFFTFTKYISETSFNILNEQGFDLTDYFLKINEIWVQEFSKNGGGHHNNHNHWNGHISGFYFLKCSDKTSYPIFHDPRPGKKMLQLPQKNEQLITLASESINFKIKPGMFIFFNSYLEHQFVLDHGINPFRFIHFNLQVFPKLNEINYI